MAYKLDQSIRLTPEENGTFLCDASDAYWNFSGAFGGWAVAVAVSAVNRSAGARGDLASVNAVFPDALGRAPLSVRPRKIRERARTDFWRVEFLDHAEPGAPLFAADIVMTEPRGASLTYHAAVPVVEDLPAPETLPRFPMPGGPQWLADYDQRLVSGRPFRKADRPVSLSWLREADGRPLDAVGLAAISDTYMPRVFFVDTAMHMGSTVSYSLNLFANAAELSAVGDDFLLMEADAAVIANGAYDQRGVIRARDGRVLAVTNQVAFFRSSGPR